MVSRRVYSLARFVSTFPNPKDIESSQPLRSTTTGSPPILASRPKKVRNTTRSARASRAPRDRRRSVKFASSRSLQRPVRSHRPTYEPCLTIASAELDCKVSHLALAWLAIKPTTSTVILGASKPEQIIDNLKALEVIPKLTPAILERIEGILDNKPDSAVCLAIVISTRFRCADIFKETLGSLPTPGPFPEAVRVR